MEPILLARTSHEAQLHMDLAPCPCGESRFERSSTLITLPDGDLGRRYAGRCPNCGTDREFVYRLPAEPLTAKAGVVYGGSEPSQLLDAAQWLWVSDQYAKSVPAGSEQLPSDQRRQAGARLAAAVAALDEVLKFVPDRADDVPSWAVWTAFGAAVRDGEPGRLRAGRLRAVRAAYADLLRTIDGPSGGAPAPATTDQALSPAERRTRAIRDVREAWADQHGVDDADWTMDGATGPDRRSPTPEQAWELTRVIREISGQDPATGRRLENPYSGMATYREVARAVERRWAGDAAGLAQRRARIEAAVAAWRHRHGVDDRRWHEEVRETPEADVPTAGQAWELVRAVRIEAGQDPDRGEFVD